MPLNSRARFSKLQNLTKSLAAVFGFWFCVVVVVVIFV